jgi:uncharacterized damage-inducible protein DinB
MRILSFVVSAAFAFGQSPFITDAKAGHEQVKNLIMRSAEKMPEENYAFSPTAEVRTYAKVLAHIADGNYLICGAAKGEKPEMGKVEKSAEPTRAALTEALKTSFAYCDAVIAGLTDASAAEVVPFFLSKRTRAGLIFINTAHNMEHYGNLVTYMRLKGVVPPSSEPRK